VSLGIGIIISKESDKYVVNYIRQKYGLRLSIVNNNYVSNQLLEDEMFLQATMTGCDSLTGIGVYELYKKDISKIYKEVKDTKVAEFLIDDFQKRKKIYYSDALKWIDIIKEIKHELKVEKFGLFIHFFMSSFDDEKIKFNSRQHYNVNNLNVEYIMKIEKDVLVFFD